MIPLHGTDLAPENFTLYGPVPGREPHRRPTPTSGKPEAITAVPQPPNVSQKVPIPSARYLRMFAFANVTATFAAQKHASMMRIAASLTG
jgi:hypothetical protein